MIADLAGAWRRQPASATGVALAVDVSSESAVAFAHTHPGPGIRCLHRHVDAKDADRRKRQSATVFFDRPLALP